jgi:hypothetical protein
MQRVRRDEPERDVRVADGRPAAMTAAEMLKIMEEEGFIGMWKDRDDIGDSVEFARKLREQAQRRGDDRVIVRWIPLLTII